MFPDMNITADVGLLSLQFIHMFFRDPVKILTSLSDAYLDGDAYRQELAPVHFLRTESLRSGLTAFLLEHGTGEEETAFIDTEERKNVSLPDGRDWRDEYSQRSLESVLRRERLLFKVFPEYLQEAESIQHRFELRGGVGDAAEYRQEDG